MKLHLLRAIAVCAFAAPFMSAAEAAEVPREMHGSADALAVPGMALAWGVLRGADEHATLVVIRIVTEPAVFPDVAVSGSDPFADGQKLLRAMTPSPGSIDLRTTRAHFAQFPRTELRFYAPAGAGAARTPALLVFYLGVPDTTPEFADEAQLDAYLRERIAKMHRSMPP
jgi:hypothetical protein